MPAADIEPGTVGTLWRGGCNCKLPQKQLAQLLGDLAIGGRQDILLGVAESDDAAVCRLPSGELLVASLDFQRPIVAEPMLAGKIAAANAMGDIYAMGAAPQFANAILAVAEGPEGLEAGKAMMAGMRDMAAAAGCIIVGGHTTQSPDPLCGLSVFATTSADRIKTRSQAKPGDRVLLTKPIGGGILSLARTVGYDVGRDHIDQMLQLNSAGAWLGATSDVHAMIDITGFGLLGHASEVAIASEVTIEIELSATPILKGALRLAAEGLAPALAHENFAAFGEGARFVGEWSDGAKFAFADPQTNGGLLFTISAGKAEQVLARLHADGCSWARIIGAVRQRRDGDPNLVLRGR
jgi:selenide,water dikinase